MKPNTQLACLLTCFAVILLTGCSEDAKPTSTATVTTSEVSQITSSTVTAGGEVTNDGNLTVTERGVVLDTDPNPTTSGIKFSSGSGKGTFTVTLTGLTANTVYHLRAYALNAKGTAYGETRMFTSATNLPALVTTPVSSVTPNSGSSGGTISSDGGGTITARGVCWSTSQNPTIADSKTVDGTGTGTFTSAIGNLQPTTTYYVRAYATNGAGTAYGTQVNFTTLAGLTDIDGNSYTSVVIGSQTWMGENLKVSRYRNGDPIPNVPDPGPWNELTTGAYVYYNNDAVNNIKYGKLYNWYATTDSRGICPSGWHLPSEAEWNALNNYLGGDGVAGAKMKSTSGWLGEGNGNNSSGFTGFPGGYRRNDNATFSNIGGQGFWWSSTELNTSVALNWVLSNINNTLGRNDSGKSAGMSVRCLRD